MNDLVNSRYEEYLRRFQERLEAKGYRPSKNKLRDRLLGLPEPMTREQWVENILASLMPLAEVGFARKKQTHEWGVLGGKTKQANGDVTRKAVLSALSVIRSSWRIDSTPGVRQLAQLISNKTGIKFNTVRNYVNKDTWLSK